MTECNCPSGLVVEIREVNLGDIKKLSPSPKKKKKNTDPIAEFLKNICDKVIDPGPYIWPNQTVIDSSGKVDWSRAMQNDTIEALLQSRVATFGDDVYWNPVCDNRRCGHEFQWHIKLSELKRTGLSPEKKKHVKKKGLEEYFEIRLPRSDTLVGWKILTRADQFRVDIASEDDQEEQNINGMLARLNYISGANSAQRRRFVEKMSLFDVETLRREYEEHDLFLQDTIEIRCTKCNNRNKVAIPVSKDFFSLDSATPPDGPQKEFDAMYSNSDSCNTVVD